MNKKVVSLALATTMVLSSASMAFAADLDVLHRTNGIRHSFNKVVRSASVLRDVATASENYLIEFNKEYYSVEDVKAKTEAGLSFEEAIAELEPIEIEEPGQGELEVVEVSAINAKQVKVKFGEAVGTGATTAGNYDVKTVIGLTQNPVTNAVKIDDTTIVLTLTNEYKVATDIVVSVDNIYKKGSIKETFAKFSDVITVHDTVAPTITSVTASTNTNAAQVVDVKFSEPIAPGAIFKLNGSVVTANPVVASIRDAFTISGQNLAVDKVHTLEIVGLEDYAENRVAYASESFTVKRDSIPATGQVELIQDNMVQIAFDKAMNLASLDNVDILYYDAVAKEYTPLALVALSGANNALLTGAGKIATFEIDRADKGKLFDVNNTTAELLIKVKSSVVDSLGNPVKPFEQRITTTQDLTGPVLEEVTFAKNSKGEVTKLYFHFNEVLAAAPVNTDILDEAKMIVTDNLTNLVVTDNDDIFGAGLAAGDVTLATDAKTIIVTPAADATNKLAVGTYSFKFVKNLVKDTTFEENLNKDTAQTVNFGSVANKVIVSSVDVNTTGAVDNVVTIDFNKAVKGASAINPANYQFNGKALPSNTVIKVNSDTQVEFKLPAGYIEKTDAEAVVRVTGIQPVDSSSTFVAYVGTANVLDNTAPVAEGTILSNGKIQISFVDEGIVTPVAADFVQVKLNGKLVSNVITTLTNTPVTLPSGEKVVTVEVLASTSLDHNATGFSYQYIDVDGVVGLDFTKDIILQSVEATTAPATWTAVADLNLLDSVEVITASTTATADDSTYEPTAGNATNLLKANTTIKVK